MEDAQSPHGSTLLSLDLPYSLDSFFYISHERVRKEAPDNLKGCALRGAAKEH